ncbi:MAG: CTP synthase [Rickettsiales bacterium]|jgi:CTP synthase|nr:CTP synthase [Rickettsiales bacterium]
MTKYIFITGGVVSSLGKGIIASSLGKLLKSRGHSIFLQKFDQYINVDPGTMNPIEHGEVFVTDDGAETDLDLGHYERFTNVDLNKYSSLTSGKVYLNVINKERRGEYLGKTLQIIPHVTDEVKAAICDVTKINKPDFLITEIGGTVGDIEGLYFFEAIRQFRLDVGEENTLFIHVVLIPYLNTTEELKTKPAQHSVMSLRSIGIQPDILVCRVSHNLSEGEKNKLSLFTNVKRSSVIECIDLQSIYQVPMALENEGLATEVLKKFNIKNTKPDLDKWSLIANKIVNSERSVTIAIVGKYVKLHDAYLSVAEALKHAGASLDTKIDIKWIDAEELNTIEKTKEQLRGCGGIVVPGGFGYRGVEGKINAIRVAREDNIPFLGICLGLQTAVVEFARNVVGLEDVNSIEFKPDAKNPVIALMNEQKEITNLGGTMRLGSYDCKLVDNSRAKEVYGEAIVRERHRHRYEVNNGYRKILEEKGLVFSGLSPDGNLVEMIELPQNRWFVACQFHPEFKSRLEKPHPLFIGLIKYAIRAV